MGASSPRPLQSVSKHPLTSSESGRLLRLRAKKSPCRGRGFGGLGLDLSEPAVAHRVGDEVTGRLRLHQLCHGGLTLVLTDRSLHAGPPRLAVCGGQLRGLAAQLAGNAACPLRHLAHTCAAYRDVFGQLGKGYAAVQAGRGRRPRRGLLRRLGGLRGGLGDDGRAGRLRSALAGLQARGVRLLFHLTTPVMTATLQHHECWACNLTPTLQEPTDTNCYRCKVLRDVSRRLLLRGC